MRKMATALMLICSLICTDRFFNILEEVGAEKVYIFCPLDLQFVETATELRCQICHTSQHVEGGRWE